MRKLILFLLASLTAAAPGAAVASAQVLTTDVTWASQYVVDGFRVGGEHSVWELSAKVDLFSTGFSVMPWAAIQSTRSNREFDELDAFALYSKDFFERSVLAVNLHGYYDYWQYPNSQPVRDVFGNVISAGKRQGNKFNAGVSATRLFPLAGSFVVPSYDAFYLRYWALNRSDLYQGGFMHQAKLEYSNALPRFLPGTTWQYYGLSTAATYNAGAFAVHPGWSHLTATLTTGAYALGSIFELSVNRQWSIEKTVNRQNELWTTLSFIRKI